MAEDEKDWLSGGMASELSAAEKNLRDQFVAQYMIDFNARAAALRVGFSASFASDYGQRFMDEPYVRQRIAESQQAVADDPKAESEETKRRIRARLLHEAYYTGPGSSHAARVSALAKLAAFYGMDAPVKTVNEHLHRGGVMCVPAIASVEDWEKAATESQEKLRQESQV